MIRKLFYLFAICVFMQSCISQKIVTYFQVKNVNDTLPVPLYKDTGCVALIEPNDILTIYVASLSAEASKYFNYSEKPDDENSMANGYLVDAMGNIQMPL